MSAALLAVALSDTIERFGAYGGLASIIGLGVLSLLYFAQAREVKRLREWAGRAPERAAELEQRVQADAQRRVVAQPLAPATTAAQKAEAARSAAAAALYAQVPPPPPPPPPLVGPPGQLVRPALPGAVPAAPATSASGAVTTPASEPATGAGTATPAPAAMPAAATAAAAARQTAVASRTPSVQENGTGNQETRESAAARPDPPPPPMSGGALFADEDDDSGGMSTGRIVAIVVGAIAAVVATVVVMVVLTSGNAPERKPNDFGSVTQPSAGVATPGSSSTNASGASGLDRRATRVAVLNGTTQTGLARAVADKIQQARFTITGTENNADQSVPTTTVAYRAGNERAAQIVAQVIGIDGASVQAVDANTSAAADADVIVIVGADKIG